MFDEKGQIIIAKEDCEMDADDLMMIALDAGAEDFSEEDDSYEIITNPNDFEAVHAAMGLDYVDLGKQTGRMAAEVLKGEKKASELNFEVIETAAFYGK